MAFAEVRMLATELQQGDVYHPHSPTEDCHGCICLKTSLHTIQLLSVRDQGDGVSQTHGCCLEWTFGLPGFCLAKEN